MKLELHRLRLTAKATLGDLYVDGVFECHTLEDVVRPKGVKIQDQTAIPCGRYEVIINKSPRLQRPMMRLLQVPMFDGILIHSGNNDVDTKGCILVGQRVVNDDWIQGGSKALPILQAKVQEALGRGETVTIAITNDFEVAHA